MPTIFLSCLAVLALLGVAPRALAAAPGAFSAPSVHSAPPASAWALSPVIGTLGVGLEVAYQPQPLWGVRLSATIHPLPDKLTLDRVTYKADGASPSLGLLFDLFPWRNGLRLSAGLYRFRLKADISSKVNFKNPVYDALSKQTSGTAVWNRFGPYFGLGWTGGTVKGRGFSWQCSLGAMYIGKADVGYNLPKVTVPPHLRQKYADRLHLVQESVTRKIHRYRWYPVLAVGLTYHF